MSGGASGGRAGRAASRISVVTETFPPEINGVAITLGRLVDALRARGHAVSVVCPRRPRREAEPEGGHVESAVSRTHGVAVPREERWRGRDDEVRVTRGHGARLPRGGEPKDGDVESSGTRVRGAALPFYRDVRIGLPAGRALRAAWADRRPDAVYIATEGPLGWSAVRAARSLGIPALSGFHTDFPAYASHYGIPWLAPAAWAYLRWFHNQTAGTLAASPALRGRLIRAGFRDVTVVGRGVDADRFSPVHRSRDLRRAWGAGDADLVALSVGRLAAEKNIPLAIEAFRAMARARPGTRLVIAGDGPLRAELGRAHPDALFCGMLTGARLSAHYASADVFLFPSETETFGNVTLEAMASGLAVVAYDYAAAGAHIADGESGVLAPRGDAAAFVEGAAALACIPERLPPMRRAARERAAAIGWAGVVSAFEDAVLGARPAFIPIRSGARAAGSRGAARRPTWT